MEKRYSLWRLQHGPLLLEFGVWVGLIMAASFFTVMLAGSLAGSGPGAIRILLPGN